MDIPTLNRRIGWLLADYLNETPRAVTRELMEEILPPDAGPDAEQYVYAALLGGFLGLDPDASEEDRFLLERYLQPGLRRMDPARYREDPYYRNIRIEPCLQDGWALAWQSYEPYELFLRDDLILTADLRQIPALGYFTEPFSFPSVLQDGREWMSIKPSEIESTLPAVNAAFGRVVTFGLGLGYFAYMAARKPEVTSVMVVERDPSVVALFLEHILPQIPERNKISVIQEDAFDYLEKEMKLSPPDFVFMDIWHDIADGTPLYIRARQYESRFPNTRFMYWIERSLKCALIDGLEKMVQS